MDLVIKPTERCNFNCEFCSTPPKAETNDLPVEKVKQFLDRYPDTRTIIVNGGEPLMMEPEYYEEIMNYIDEKKMDTTLCIMSNLALYRQNKEKWTPLFTRPNVSIGTSFQYGNGRKDKDGVYSDDSHQYISTDIWQLTGRMPMFISVISEENEDTAINNVKLAARMNTTCKLNPAMASGRQKKPYPLYKMYRIYLKLIELGLDKHETNSAMLKDFKNGTSHCSLPYERQMCDKGIRCLGPRGEYHSCPAIADDHYYDKKADMKTYEINFNDDMDAKPQLPLASIELLSLKTECFSCSLYKLCNNCSKYVKDSKKIGSEFIEKHCKGMKEIQDKLEKYV